MSKTGMWATIALIILLAIGAWWYVSTSGSAPAPDTAPIADTTQPAAAQPDTAGISGDASDTSLDQDLKTIDAHVDAAASAGASADAFTDTPIEQTE